MNLNKRDLKKLLWITPAVVALLIALIPTLRLQWPLTVDIFCHIHIAQLYSQYGLTLIDPLIDPGMGTKIGYPPLFSLILAFLVKILEIDYFQAAKLLQLSLAFLVVLSVSYVTKKFYGDIAGISAGFLIMASYLFSRLVSPLPETMALIFALLVVYFYWKSVEEKKYSYALISGLMFILVVLTHQATILIMFLVITAITLILGIIRMDIKYFISYALFLIFSGGIIVLSLELIEPGIIQNIIRYGLTAATGFQTAMHVNDPISYIKYVVSMGIAFLFAIIGGAFALWKRRDQDIIVLVWLITVFLISKAYWFGINVLSIRLLIHLLIPVSILGGLGLSYLYLEFCKKEFTSKIRSGFLISTLIISSLFAVVTVEDPNFGSIPRFVQGPQIAPPTESDADLVQWFSKNGNKEYIALSNNYFTTQFILANTRQPIASFYKLSLWASSGFNESIINNASSGYYFIFDKRFTFYSSSDEHVRGGGQATFFNNRTFHPKNLLPARVVYENKDYTVYKKSF